MSFELKEITGDIFTASKEYSLAHCVGADLTMGKGIALSFRNSFGQRERLRKQNVGPGGVAILEDERRFIYYLVTKELSSQQPTYEALLSSLKAMRAHMKKNGINKLAIPRLGSGVDNMDWTKVKSQIIEVFEGDSIEIVVYNLVRNTN